jgi:rubredoxin/flavin reductase (DIM6/NTAB) family NADH-FMN oxidoreductase RutF
MKYKALHKLSYGLYIISTSHEGKSYGYVGNTVFQVTSSPPQIAISCHKENVSTSMILKSRIFSVSVLRKETDSSLIGRFGFMSGDSIDKFENINTIKAVTGAPVVTDDTVAWFDCEVVSDNDVGSHIIIIGLIKDSGLLSDEAPLTYDYYREKYKMLSPVNSPTYIKKAVLEEEGFDESVKEGKEKDRKPGGGDETDIYTCSICGYRYHPAEGDPTANIPPGTPFSELPEDYKCPVCNAGKEYFRRS